MAAPPPSEGALRCMYVCQCVCVYVYDVCMYVCMCKCDARDLMHGSEHVRHVCMYVCMCTYVSLYVCMYVGMYVSRPSTRYRPDIVYMYVCMYV